MDKDNEYFVPTGLVPRMSTIQTPDKPLVPYPDTTSIKPTTNKIPEPQDVKTNHSHYFKSVKHLNEIDVYRVLDLFEVTDPCIQHAVKKLLVAGGRGAGKGFDKDIQEAIDSLKRLQVMRSEDVSVG